MEQQVIYRDRQELQAADLNNTQGWMDEAQRHLVTDAITPERQFVGLTVTARSATEIEVAPGRLYDGSSGKVFAIESAQVHSVFAMLPLQDSKWLAVSAFGQEEDTDIQPRDFLIDLQTREVEPEAVAMQRRRVAVIHIAQGLESPTPERPEPPTGYTLLAHVRLSPTGIQEVVLATSRKLPNLFAVDQRLRAAEGWIASAEPRIAHIMSDIAGLGSDLQTRASIEHVVQLGMDMAKLKERMEIPDDYTFYGADHYLNEDESDPAQSGYSADVREGIRPAVVASQTGALSLLNPMDPEARVSANGLLLPAYEEITRLRMETRAGEMAINAYQYQTLSATQRSMSRERIRYGETLTYCTNSAFWRSGVYDPVSGILRRGDETWLVDPADRQAALRHAFVRVTRVWIDHWEEPYWDIVTTTHTVQGSILAQTVLMAQTGWLTSLEVFVTSADPAGGLTVLVTEAALGQPDITKVLSRATLAPGAVTAGWLKVTLPDPLLVESGKRYAIVLASGAAHRVGYTAGTEYTQGLLMYAQDGAYFTAAAERDLMLRLNFARFTSPRAVVQMQPLQLAGGIQELDMLYESAVPAGCRLVWEYQTGGMWRPVTTESAPQFGGAALVPLRAVFIGTTDLMPAVRHGTAQVTVRRRGTSFVHISTARTLAQASSNIRVRLLLEDFSPAAGHTVDCKLIIGGSPVTAASYRDEIVDGRSRWREYRFTPAATTSYRIRIEGTGVTAAAPWHVAERYDLAL
ncbi:hypothetical protein LCC91_07680 [Tepidimonas taiwanensis]|uniref:DUF4815 domain-containing protein n=1 Tax=Tepidimonas taiwanensis TaxID=307486 RepID=A0A554XAZ4_9BURK|nr:hypothetical protein [Tepidimonas taiwanensis]TSE33010.1 hypothetical protein Ttaiw_00871 [Tepidimonas taiwanensis]UBQ04454.1 hypothetical protein LCC91_07680 [Tepidimonas taiwanensis]